MDRIAGMAELAQCVIEFVILFFPAWLRAMVGWSELTSYLAIIHHRYNKKTHKIDAVNWNQSPKDRFRKFDGSMITFTDYYREVRILLFEYLNREGAHVR